MSDYMMRHTKEVRVDEHDYAWLADMAKRSGLEISEIIGQALDLWRDERGESSLAFFE